MRKNLNLTGKVILSALIVTFFSGVRVNAAENSVLGISVKQNNTGEYNVLLKLSNASGIKKSFDGKSLILAVPNAIPSDTMEILYDNASELQNITVQKKNADSTIIVLQGSNIENSQIFTKDISTGLTKKSDESTGILNDFLFIADKKLLALLSFASLLLTAIISALRPKKKNRLQLKQANTAVKSQNKAMTLRRKNMLQADNIPSINYRHNGSFNAANISIPRDFSLENANIEEQIRKAG